MPLHEQWLVEKRYLIRISQRDWPVMLGCGAVFETQSFELRPLPVVFFFERYLSDVTDGMTGRPLEVPALTSH